MESELALATRTTAAPEIGSNRVCVVVGAGDATGSAIAKRFAREGFVVCAARRNGDKLLALVEAITASGGTARAFGCDAREEEQVVLLFDRIEREVGPVSVMIFNVGGNVSFPILETTSRVYRKVWEMACFGGFLSGREAARYMLPRRQGTIIFTGATASIRGGSGFSAFSGAKHALRALAQSMARELGPEGIHVAHCVIDGPIDTAFTRECPDLLAQRQYDSALLNPEGIAEVYWQLHRQPRSAWTHELDLRPWGERW